MISTYMPDKDKKFKMPCRRNNIKIFIKIYCMYKYRVHVQKILYA